MHSVGKDWGLITGASSGLGVAFGHALAARGINLVLTARSEAPMQRLAAELRATHGVEIVVEALDLSVADSPGVLRDRLAAREIAPDILINNAAFGLSDAFVDDDPERLRAMLQLNMISLAELSLVLGKDMAARGRGHMLFVASTAAYQPTPRLAAYGATKAFVLSLGESLRVELAPAVAVTVLAPGLMDTGFNAVSGFRAPPGLDFTKLAPAQVARIGLAALFAGKPSVVAGRANQAMVFVSRLLPRHVSARTAFKMAERTGQVGG